MRDGCMLIADAKCFFQEQAGYEMPAIEFIDIEIVQNILGGSGLPDLVGEDW